MFLNFVYFYFFHGLRRWVGATLGSSFVDSFMVVHEGTETPPSAAKKVAVDLISGYLAGVVAVLVTGPLWLGEMNSHYVSCCIAWLLMKIIRSEYAAEVTGVGHWPS